MLLSEAIRLGATLGPQTRHFSIASGGASCALGAAARAIGLIRTDYQSLTYDTLQRAFPVFQGDSGWRLMRNITELNDLLYLSREEIADWIVENGFDCESELDTTDAIYSDWHARTTNAGKDCRPLQWI